MATAPEPGVGKRNDDAASARQILVVKYDGEELRLAWRNLSMLERVAVRKETGLPYDEFIRDPIGSDSLCVLWWLARRANGEPSLNFSVASEEWGDGEKYEDVDVEGLTDDTEVDHPEA